MKTICYTLIELIFSVNFKVWSKVDTDTNGVSLRELESKHTLYNMYKAQVNRTSETIVDISPALTGLLTLQLTPRVLLDPMFFYIYKLLAHL